VFVAWHASIDVPVARPLTAGIIQRKAVPLITVLKKPMRLKSCTHSCCGCDGLQESVRAVPDWWHIRRGGQVGAAVRLLPLRNSEWRPVMLAAPEAVPAPALQ